VEASVFSVESSVLAPSYLTVEDLDQFLRGTHLAGTGEAFMRAEAEYGASARFLVALAAVESALGASDAGRNRHNLFGILGMRWDTTETGIDGGAAYIARNFLQASGRFYHGPTLRGMHVSYATSPTWAEHVALWMNRIPASAAPAFAARFDYLWMPREVDAGETMPIIVSVRNWGSRPWVPGGGDGAALSLRVFDPLSSREIFPSGIPSVSVDQVVHNHQQVSLAFEMPAPSLGGAYRFRLGARVAGEWMPSPSGPALERTVMVRPLRAHWQMED